MQACPYALYSSIRLRTIYGRRRRPYRTLRVILSNLACMWGVIAGARSRVKKTEIIQPVIVNKKIAVFH
jgi:hypothetical protein